MGNTTVYFYRTGQFVGSAVKYHIRDGNDITGALKSNSYFKYIDRPGEHFFWAENEKGSSVTVDCHPGEKYYAHLGKRSGPCFFLAPEPLTPGGSILIF